MEKEFVSYQIALALKELGFNEPCFTYYYDISGELRKNISVDIHNGWTYFPNIKLITLAPTFSQAFRWFLKKHKLYAVIIPTITMHWTYLTMTVVENMIEVPPYKNVKAYDYSIKEEAELECLLKMIEIVKNKS